MVIILKLLALFFLVLNTLVLNKSYENNNTSTYCVLEEKSQRILEGNNEHKISLIASTTKILTCIVAIESNNIYKNVKVKEEDVNIEGSKVYFTINEEVYLIDVLYGLMLKSGNDCANILAREVYGDYDFFIKKMNDKCKEIGMKNSTFLNPSGLDSTSCNYSTAYDMSLLMLYAMKNDVFREIAGTKMHKFKTNNRNYSFINKHKLVLNDDRFIAGKTGYTKKSGRILVSYVREKNINAVITTIDDSNDWVNHKTFADRLNIYNKEYKISKGEFIYNNRKIILNEDIVIPICSNEKELYYKIILNIEGVYLFIFKKQKVILNIELEIE